MKDNHGLSVAGVILLWIAVPAVYAPVLTISSYWAGDSYAVPIGIALDSSSNIYIGGVTTSGVFPTKNSCQKANVAPGAWDYFICKLDPSGRTLLYGTFFGGNNHEYSGYVHGAFAVDAQGCAYIGGFTGSADFPTKNAWRPVQVAYAEAVFVKVNPSLTGTNTLVFSTFLTGSGHENLEAVTTDSAGNSYVVGSTASTDFSTINAFMKSLNGSADAYIAKFNPTGGVIFSTYYGGTGYEYAYGIAIDTSSNIYVTGKGQNFTLTTRAFQTANAGGTYDGYISAFDPNCTSLLYSSYLGGNAEDWATDIVVDNSSNAYIVGSTPSINFPTRNAWQKTNAGNQDIFITKINPALSGMACLVFSTYMGGITNEYHAYHSIKIDASSNVYVYGGTLSVDFPITNALFTKSGTTNDVYLAKFDKTGTNLLYTTYFGGTGEEYSAGSGMALDSRGTVYIAGKTYSENIPTINAYKKSKTVNYETFFARIEDPVLGVSALGFTNVVMAGHTVTNALRVWNPSDGTLNYRAITNVDWLTASPSSGSCDVGTNPISFLCNSTGLAAGVYNGTVVVTGQGARLSPQMVAIAMTVNPRPLLSVNPGTVTQTILEGKDGANQVLTMQNGSGSYTLDYRLSVVSGGGWMGVSPTNGLSTGEVDNVILSYTTAGLARGVYTGQVLVTGTDTNYGEGASGAPVTVPVVVTMSHPLPSVAVSVTGLAQCVQKGANATNQAILVSNGNGNYTLSYGVGGNQSWFSVSPTNGTSTGDVDVATAQYAVSGFDGGTYTGQVTVVGVDATYGDTAVSSPWVIPVSVYVVNPGTPLLSASDGDYTDKVRASWSGVTNAANYQVWRGTSGTIGSASLVTTVTETSYDDATAEPGTLKYYWVRAVNAYGGVGSFSALDTGWRGLGVPTGVTASDGSYTDKVVIGWSQVLDVSGYQVWCSTMNDSGSAQLLGSASGSGVTNYEDYGANPGVLYYYWVKIVCSGGTGDFSSVDSGWRGLESPGGVSASDGTYPDKVRVRWGAVSGAELYEVWRGSGEVSGAEMLGETMGVRYDDTNAVAGVAYDYWVRVKCALGSSAYSASDQGWRATAATPYVRDGEEGDVNITTNSTLVFRWGSFANERLDHCEVAIGTSETNLAGCLGWTGVYGPEGRYQWGTEMALGRWYYNSVRGVDENGAVVVGPVTSDGITYVGNKLAPVYRVYSYGAPESTYEHLYTMNAVEVEVLDSWPSWQAEGVAWYGLVSQEGLSAPLYRMYNGFWRQHYYTADTDEYIYLGEYRQDWDGEGVQYYVMREAAPGTTPVYHFYHPGIVAHFYTMDENEAMTILANAQWGLMYQGISFHVFPTDR